MSANMTDWDSQIILRFKTLLNVSDISGDVGEAGTEGKDDEAKLKRVALARNRNSADVQAAHLALTALAFDGSQEWHAYDDDKWTTNCLGQVLDEDQNFVLLAALREAELPDLADAVQKMADDEADDANL